MTERSADHPDAYALPFDEQIHLFLDEQVVPSKTTLLGLVKHATFVERVWFEEAFTGQPRPALRTRRHPARADPRNTRPGLRDQHPSDHRAR
jgi:hypothetical protein